MVILSVFGFHSDDFGKANRSSFKSNQLVNGLALRMRVMALRVRVMALRVRVMALKMRVRPSR